MPGVDSIIVGGIGRVFGAIGGNTNDQQDREVKWVLDNKTPADARAILVAWRDGVIDPRWSDCVGASPPAGSCLAGRVNGGRTTRAAHQREVAGRAVTAIDVQTTGYASLAPTGGQIPNVSTIAATTNASGRGFVDTLQASVQRAIAAGEAELLTRIGVTATAGAAAANAREQQASLVPLTSFKQLAIGAIVVVLVVMFIRKSK